MSVRQTLTNEVKNFTDNWSGHGVHRVAISGNIVKKLFYTGVFITCVVLFGYQIRKLILKYYSYPVNTVIEVNHDSLRFPAVTICNKNVVRKSKLSLGGTRLQEIVNRSEETFGTGMDHNNYTHLANRGQWETGGVEPGTISGPDTESNSESGPSSEPDSASASEGETATGPDNGDNPIPPPNPEDPLHITSTEDTYYSTSGVPWLKAGLKTEEAAIAQNITMALVKVNITSRLAMGHQLSEMLQSCSINGETCSTKNFTAFYNVLYGNCYTFNGMSTARAVHTFQSGPMFGLNMELVIEQDEYIGSLTKTAGIRLTVHDPFNFPFPEDNGIDLSPGKVTSVGLKLKVFRKLGPPYSVCTTERGVKIAYRGNYTVEACRKTCLQDFIVRMCNCTDTRYSNSNFYSARPCDRATDYECITVANSEYLLIDNCVCPAACKMNVYQQTVSSADFPSSASEGELRAIIMARSNRLKSIFGAEDPSVVDNNLLQVQVFFETLQHEKISEHEAYDFEALLSDVGGQAGLLIGWSVISFVEIFEFLGNLIWIVIKSLIFRKTPTSDKIIKVSPTIYTIQKKQLG